MTTVTWSASVSSMLARRNGELNMGAGQDLHIASGYITGGDAPYQLRGAVKFYLDYSGVGQISSAVLSVKTTGGVHIVGAFGASPDLYVERITTPWTPNGASGTADGGSGWSTASANYGDIGSTSTGRTAASVTNAHNTWVTLDITDIVEAWAPTSVKKRDGTPGGAQPNYGVLIRPQVEFAVNDSVEFFSALGSDPPIIVVTVSADPGGTSAAPTTTIVSPSGTVVVAHPIFSGVFSDPGDTMREVSINVNDSHTAFWDYTGSGFSFSGSTWSITYAGRQLKAGTTYYGTVAVRDSGGLWSPGVTFQFDMATASGGGGGGGGPSRVTTDPALFREFPARIEIFAMDGNRGPGTLKAVIDDAKNIGVSDYANDVGEAYWTLPYNHPQIAELVPLQRHYRVSRYDTLTSTYKTVGRGIVEDFEASGDEVIFYGHNYMGFLETTLSNFDTNYTSQSLGSIVSDQITLAKAVPNSRLAFVSAGTIDSTSQTATLLTSFQPAIDFIRAVASISMNNSSVRTIFSITRDAPYTFNFIENQGSEDLTGIRLEYGGSVNGFWYIPGYRNFATTIGVLGVKREGAAVLFSTQTYASTSTYGTIERPFIHYDVVDQTALDSMAKFDARVAGTPEKKVSLVLRSRQLTPWSGFELGDSVRVMLQRGSAINVNGLYTIWGMEWTTDQVGGENLFLSLATKLT